MASMAGVSVSGFASTVISAPGVVRRQEKIFSRSRSASIVGVPPPK